MICFRAETEALLLKKQHRDDVYVYFHSNKCCYSAYLFALWTPSVPPCPMCHPVPGEPRNTLRTHPPVTILLLHMGHITLWNPLSGAIGAGKHKKERERAHTHLPSLTHASFLPRSNDNSRSLGNLFLRVTGSYRAVDAQFDGYIDVWHSFPVCIYGTSAAMIHSILLSHLFSIYIKASLARWSLEWDEVMGSVRFGDRGLLFKHFLWGVFS